MLNTKKAVYRKRFFTTIQQQTMMNKIKYLSVNSLQNCFTKTGKMQESAIEIKPIIFNKVLIEGTKINQFLEKMDTNKGCGPENLRNIILKKIPILLKSISNCRRNWSLRGQILVLSETLLSNTKF